MGACVTPSNAREDRFSMILVLGTVVGGAVVMAGAAVVFLMMLTHF
jgi:hypothetical protein